MRDSKNSFFSYKGLFTRVVCKAFPVALPLVAAALLVKGGHTDFSAVRWASTLNAMTAARGNACAVALAGGRVLIAGGDNDAGALTSAEILENTGRFHAAAPMLSAHTAAGCAALPDGSVIVAGGRANGGISNAVEIYNPSSNSWNAAPPMVEGRAGAAVSVLNDGRVLFSGGETASGSSDSLEIYDPASRSFASVNARLSSGRTQHAAAVLQDGRVLIAGGSDGRAVVDTADIFDPTSGEVVAAGRLTTPRAGLTATTLPSGRVLIAGGGNRAADAATAEIFDPQTGMFTADGSRMTSPRRGHTAILVPDNNTVLFAGGTAIGPNGPQPLSQTEIYIPWRHEFRAIADLQSAKTGIAAVALATPGKLAIAGGRGLAGAQNGAETIVLPTIVTAKASYQESETVEIRGSGWVPGAAIELSISPDSERAQGATTTVTADDFGNLTGSTNAPEFSGASRLYVTAVQRLVEPGGRTTLFGAQNSAPVVASIRVFGNCRGNGSSSSFSFGIAVCATASGLSTKIGTEVVAWSDSSGNLVRAVSASIGNNTAQDTETPNSPGSWTVQAYPASACTLGNASASCTGTPDASVKFTVGAGQLVFGSAAISIATGSCSPAISVQLQSGNSPVAPTIATPLQLGSSSATGKFFAASGCNTPVTSVTVPANSSSATFYYSDSTPGKPQISAGSLGFTSATQSETITGVAGPSVSMAFGADTMPLNGSTSLTFTISNNSGSSSITGVSLTDTLPAGLAIASPNGLAGSCGGGTITASSGSSSITLSGATLAASASCSFSVNVTGTSAGSKTNTCAMSTDAGQNTSAAATIGVAAPPSISLAFGASSVAANGSTSLTVTIANPAANSVALAGVGFSNALPSGLSVASTPSVTNTCGGTLVSAAGSSVITLAGASVPVNSSCTVSVSVTAASTATDSVTVNSSTGGSGNTASATLQVGSSAAHLSLSAPSSAVAGSPVTVTVSALDASNNALKTYSGTVHFTSTDSQATLPPDGTLANGSGSFTATLKTAGTQTLTVTDTSNANMTGNSSVAVTAATPAAISVNSGSPQSAATGSAFALPLQAVVKDASGNPVSGATVTFTAPSSGAGASLSGGTAVTNASGIATVNATANTVAGSYTVTASAGSASTSFSLTNTSGAPLTPTVTPTSVQLGSSTSGSYSIPNAAPYAGLGSFYLDLRITSWGRLSGSCAPITQFVGQAQWNPSQIRLCDPAYGWGAIMVTEPIDGVDGGVPVWLNAPNINIASATATNPMTITLTSAPFPSAMSVGSTISIMNASGTGCSGMNTNLVITAVSGNTLTLNYNNTGCAYTAGSGSALSQDFVFRYHRDLASNQLVGEVWNVDGTGYASNAQPISAPGQISLPQTSLTIGGSAPVSLAYLRWYSGTIPVGAAPPSGSSGGNLADWEFESNGNDNSGNGMNISFGSQPTYSASPAYAPACNAGQSQTFRTGQSATLDGSASFPLDGGTALAYSWSQIPSTAAGVPLQSISWSSTTVAKPVITGLTFGPADFQLTVTQGNGQSATCTVHHGAVAADSNNVVTVSTGNTSLDAAVNTLIGPQMQLGKNPWPFYDQAAAANAATQIAHMDIDYSPYWDVPNAGTVTVTLGSKVVTGVGTTFTTTFCQGPGNPTVPQSGATIIVWYKTGRTVNGAPETGRRRMTIYNCVSDTQLNAYLPSNGTAWTSDAPAGSGLQYTAEFLNHMWEFGAAPANYYDNVQAYYALYYRSGIDTYLNAARKLADRFWASPEIDRGLAFNVGDWFGGQSGRSNSISGLVLRALDTGDGHADMWSGLHNVWTYTNYYLVTGYPYWSINGGMDEREYGYTLAQAAYGALFDTDPTWQAYCRSMIGSSFQSGAGGIWPKNIDGPQQAWLNWWQMKSTFDSGQAWSASTVTLTNGSNVVTCASGNCGWQASDFASYDANSGAACTSGSTCAPPPVLFTDSATFPADSSHTDNVAYCQNGCSFVDSNHFTLDRPYSGVTGIHGWVFGVSNGSIGGNNSGTVGWGALPYMEGILGWAFDLAGKAMACTGTGVPANCDNTTSATAFSYGAKAANWISTYGALPAYYGVSYYAGFPQCGTSISASNVWCNRGFGNIQSREMMGDAYRGLAAAYRRSPTTALKTTIDNWFAGMWGKPATNPLLASPDGQYDVNFDPTGCGGCGYYLNNGAPYSQKFFGQHFGISNEGGWPAIRIGY